MYLCQYAYDTGLSHVELALDASARPVKISRQVVFLLAQFDLEINWSPSIIIKRELVNKIPTTVNLIAIPILERIVISFLLLSDCIDSAALRFTMLCCFNYKRVLESSTYLSLRVSNLRSSVRGFITSQPQIEIQDKIRKSKERTC
jgi:hypothetical protein